MHGVTEKSVPPFSLPKRHVWTAPRWQEIFDGFRVECSHVSGMSGIAHCPDGNPRLRSSSLHRPLMAPVKPNRSSLSYLKNLTVDELKIDLAFISGMRGKRIFSSSDL